MQTNEYLDVIRRQSELVAVAGEQASLDTAVTSCPGWTLGHLIEHLGNVQRWAALTVATRPATRIPRADMNEFPAPDELVAWFRAASAGLVAALAAADLDADIWTFVPDGTMTFWFRRQAQEVSVHRWDAECAAGRTVPIDAELAADGIGEWLDMSSALAADRFLGDGETVHLHCTDTPAHTSGEWLITFTPNGPTVDPVHAKGDVAARGTASDLLLFLWGRVDPTQLEVFGDVELLERFRAAGVD